MSELSTYRRSSGLLGSVVQYWPRIGSTNDVLLRLGEQGAPEGTLVIADEQTAGRGRLGRRWLAPAGTALLFSLLFRPTGLFVQQMARIPMGCGVALVEAIQALTGLPVQLKWPNDVILNPETDWRKVAGMLSDVGMLNGAPAFLVVGIGVNVNVPMEQLASLSPNAGSLSVALGRPVERAALLEAFLTRADAYYAELCRGWDPLPVWSSYLAWTGKTVKVDTPSGMLEGIFEGVGAEGELVLRVASGWRYRFNVGDVTLRLV